MRIRSWLLLPADTAQLRTMTQLHCVHSPETVYGSNNPPAAVLPPTGSLSHRPAPCAHQHKGFKVVSVPLDLSAGDEAQQHDARIAPHIIPEVCQQLILRDATFYTCEHQCRHVRLSLKLLQSQLLWGCCQL